MPPKASNSTEVWINPKLSVKFPFEPYECQRIFMKNVVDVLDRKLDAALESPTGTGKTLSLLCSTLAWVQRQKETKPLDFATWQTSGAGGAEKTDEKLKSAYVPTIFYASRTHSQLEQVVHELNRTEYKWVKTTILGSREHFCINQKVKKIKESNRQAHVCRGLVSKRACHYYNKFDACTTDKMTEFLDKGEAMDIEDFVKLGTQNSLCPYFMSRQRSETAELILLPYNYIIDPKMRRRYKLDLKNSIVIFDEAHNLESICESNASAELTSTSIALCIEELKKVLALLVDEEETARSEADAETGAFGSAKIDLTKKLIENLRTEDLMTVLEKIFSLEEEMDKLFGSSQLKSVPPLSGKASDGEILLETLAKAGFDANSVERLVDVLRDAISYLLSKNEEVALTEKGDGMEKVADFLLSIYSTHAQDVAAAVGEETVKLVDRVDPKTVARNCKLYIQKDKDNEKLTIKYFCFQASISMRMLKMRGVRNVLLASGTLSPIQAFTYNMGLNFGAILENEHALKQVPVLTSIVTRGKRGGLAGSFQNRKNLDYVTGVAEALLRVMEVIPQGILIFFSSYSQMDELVATWKTTKWSSNSNESFWEKMEKTKRVVVEPRAKEELAAIRLRYTQIKMVTFKDHITGDILMEAENGAFEFAEELFFKFKGNYIDVKVSNGETKKTVDLLQKYQMKKFDMWGVEKDIFDFGQKLGELVETKMYGDNADFTYMVDYIFNLRAWFKANRETKDIKVYMGPSSTYMSHAYAKNFTPVFVKDENGIPFIYIFKETVHADGLIEDQIAGMSLKEKDESKVEDNEEVVEEVKDQPKTSEPAKQEATTEAAGR